MNSTHPYYLPMLHRHMRLGGTEFPHFVTSVGNCCPSRTVLLTGRHCHNNNLTANDPPHGGYVGFKNKKLDESYLPLWLKAAGYKTFMVGKALNGFSKSSADSSYAADKLGCLPGWDHIMPPIGPPTQADQDDIRANLAKDPPVYIKHYYTNCEVIERMAGFPDDNLFDRATSLIEDAADSGSPFYLQIDVSAPHDGPVDGLPRIADRYMKAFPGLKVPKGPNYGFPTDPRFSMSKQTPLWWNLTDSDVHYRARAQSLLAIDEHLDGLINKLECLGILDNTVILWTSDNGFKLGQHNIPQEKFTYFEEDTAMPMFIRGPGVPRGVYAGTVQAAMVDVTATILHLAGAAAPPPYLVDGAPLPLELVAQLNPTPNTPFLDYMGAYWNSPAGTPIAEVPGSQDTSCTRLPRPPPLAPMPPRPPPCKGKKCDFSAPSDEDDSEEGLLSLNDKFDASAAGGGGIAARGHRLLSAGWARMAASRRTAALAAQARAAAMRGLEDGGRQDRVLQAPLAAPRISNWSNLALIEQWKFGRLWRANDYRVIRACMPPSAPLAASPAGSTRTGQLCYKYVVFCNADLPANALTLNQLFNLTDDQAEIKDLLLRTVPAATRRLIDRLDAALTVLSYCSGPTCSRPFDRIHPGGAVVNLAEAMDPSYDTLYAGFKKLTYRQCAQYYDPANESPDPRLVPVEWGSPPPAEARPPPRKGAQPPPPPKRRRRQKGKKKGRKQPPAGRRL